MSVKLKGIIEVMEGFAPKYLKEEYDNVGLMVGDKDKEITKVLLALDCTLEVIDEAVTVGAELIITHHPLLFRRPSQITSDTLQGRKIIKLISEGVNLYSSHTNLDSVHGGMNDILMDMLDLKDVEILEENLNYPNKNHGIGRIGTVKECTLKDFIYKIKEEFQLEGLRYTGDLEKKITKVAVINGSGQDYIDLAIKKGAHCVITGDSTYHYASDYEELGFSIIDIGHFQSEWKIFLKVIERIFKEEKEFNDLEFIVSKKSKDPYKFL